MSKQRKTAEDLEADALYLLCSRSADRFTMALHRMGWMIVPQPDTVPPDPGTKPPRWSLNNWSKDCPPWCDNAYLGSPRPSAEVIPFQRDAGADKGTPP
jgi:hypothetical protein